MKKMKQKVKTEMTPATDAPPHATAGETPAAPGPGEFKTVPRSRVRPDPEQPRKEFDEEALTELAWSIRERGIIQPLVVQFVPGLKIKEPDMIEKNWQAVDASGSVVFEGPEEKVKLFAEGKTEDWFQIIFGERRYRASGPREFEVDGEKIKWAGLNELPVIVREVTDQDKFVLQFIENNHRVNLSALEEARAFEEQIKKRRHSEPSFGPEKLAAELGNIKRSTIYNRLKLLRLHSPVRQALIAGKIEAMVATEIATIPDPKKQEQLLEKILTRMDYDSPMHFREVSELIEDEYVKQLKDGPFDREDATLVPVQWRLASAPVEKELILPCKNQPRMTHPQTIGFPKIESGTFNNPGSFVCTHDGFELAGPLLKKDAKALVEFLTANITASAITVARHGGGACADCPHRSGVMNPEAKNPNVCTLPQCFDAKVKAHWTRKSEELKAKGTVVLTEGEMRKRGKHVPAEKHEYTQSRSGTWKELMGKHAPEPVLVATKQGIKKFYPLEEAKTAAKKNGVKFYSHGTPKTAEEKAQEEQEKKNREAREERRKRLVKSLWEDLSVAVAGLKEAEAWELALELADGHYMEAHKKKVLVTDAKSTRAKVLGILLANDEAEPVDWRGEFDKDKLKVWKRLGIDLEKLDKDAERRAEGELALKKAAPQQKELLTVKKTKKKK